MFLPVEVLLVTSGQGSDPMATRVITTQFFGLCLFQILLAQVLLICLNLPVLRIQFDTGMMRILSQSFGQKTSMYPYCHLSDLVELWWTDVPHDKHCRESSGLTSAHSSSILLLSSKLLSFFGWLVTFWRIWHGVNPLIVFGQYLWLVLMCWYHELAT